MTTSTSILLLLLAAALAEQGLALAQGAPPVARSDAARASKALSDSSAAYKRLRSYSGRFQMVNPFEVQSGEIRWALPNRLSMRMETRSKRGTYTLRAVSDGRFIYIADSRLRGNFIKQPAGGGATGAMGAANIGSMITALNVESMMVMAALMSGLDPLEGVGAVRITSSPQSPTLALEARYNVSSAQDGATEMTTTLSEPDRMTFRFGADKLLRELTIQQPAPQNTRATEKHWDIRHNPTLPASTFKWKPAPGARQVQSLEAPR